MAHGVELVRGETAEVVFGDLAVAEQGGEDDRQDGIAVVEGAVDPAAALGEPVLQVPEFGGFRDPGGAFPGFPDNGLQFPAEGEVEGSAGDGLLRRRPLPSATPRRLGTSPARARSPSTSPSLPRTPPTTPMPPPA